MYYAVTLEFASKVPAELALEQRAALGAFTEQGILMLSGPFTDGAGGMAILRASSIEEATSLYETTPIARSGTVPWHVREWDARAGFLAPHLPTA